MREQIKVELGFEVEENFEQEAESLASHLPETETPAPQLPETETLDQHSLQNISPEVRNTLRLQILYDKHV